MFTKRICSSIHNILWDSSSVGESHGLINRKPRQGIRGFDSHLSYFIFALIAQLVERLICNQYVQGSSPTGDIKPIWWNWQTRLP